MHRALSNAVFGGADFTDLYVTCGDKACTRKTEQKGVLSRNAPIKPRAPGFTKRVDSNVRGALLADVFQRFDASADRWSSHRFLLFTTRRYASLDVFQRVTE